MIEREESNIANGFGIIGGLRYLATAFGPLQNSPLLVNHSSFES